MKKEKILNIGAFNVLIGILICLFGLTTSILINLNEPLTIRIVSIGVIVFWTGVVILFLSLINVINP